MRTFSTKSCSWDDDDDVRFELDQHTELDWYNTSSQSAGRHVAPLWHNFFWFRDKHINHYTTDAGLYVDITYEFT